jgi:transposase
MSQYPGAGHLTSWAGICPGNHKSAGERKSGKASKGTYLSPPYRCLAGRRGSKRAAVAVAHSILVAVYYILKRGAE